MTVETYKIFFFTLEYKENVQVRLTCSLCAALAHLLTNSAEVGWLTITENVPHNEKLTLIHAYYVQQLMKNQNVPIELWNINKDRN